MSEWNNNNPEKKELNSLLKNDIFSNKQDFENNYQIFLDERNSILNSLSNAEKTKLEMHMKIHIGKMFINAKKDAESDDLNKGFFRYEDVLNNKIIDKYFNIIVANGDRNIGKSWSSWRLIRDTIKKNKRFMIWRNTEEEVKQQLISDTAQDGWLTKNGYTYINSKKMPDIIDRHGNLVGYYRSVNTASKFKSISFQNVGLIVYEEYAEGNVSNKFEKMIKFISTIQRHNKDLKVILQANYTNQNDEILQSLGLGAKKLDNHDFTVFDWTIGSLIINIPRGVYRRPKNKLKDVAQRAALANYSVWGPQFGSVFMNEEPINIVSESDITGVEPIFNIYILNPEHKKENMYGAYKITFYKTYLADNTVTTVVRQSVAPNNKPIFVFDNANRIRYKNAIIIELDRLENLIYHWQLGNIKTVDVATHQLITAIFAQGLKLLEKNKKVFVDIENVVE